MATNYNWTSANVDDFFASFTFDGPITTGVHNLTSFDVLINGIYYSQYINVHVSPVAIKKGTINIESLDAATQIARGTYTFEVGSMEMYKNGFISLPVTVPNITGSFRFKYENF